MYGIKIDGVWADLSPGQTVKLMRWNSLFDFETVRGSLVNDFTLPFSPINDKLFGWFREPGMKYPNKQYYCEKIADGYVIERGFIELVDCTETEYVVIFTQNLSEIFGEYQNVLLNKLPLGGVSLVGTPTMAANHLTDVLCWPTVANSAFYGTNVQAGWNGKMNEWVTSATLSDHARVPMLFLRWVFERIGVLCDFRFEGDFFDSEVFKRAVVYNCFSLDDATTITYANHLPEMTIPELIKELRKLFNLAIYFNVNSRTMFAYFGNEILTRPTVLNWTKKIVPSASRTPERLNRIKLDWELDQGDTVMKRVPLPAGFDFYQTSETQRGFVFEIVSKISTVAVVAGVATVEQIGATPRFNQGGAKFAPRIALWNGVVGGVPTISNVCADTNFGNWNIAWSGANNLKDKCYSNYEVFRKSTSSKVVLADLTALDLHQIDWHNNVHAHHSVFVKGKEYFVASVETLLPLNGRTQVVLWEK